VDQLSSKHVAISMTEENHCYENALAERVNGILKHEYYLKGKFITKAAARMLEDRRGFLRKSSLDSPHPSQPPRRHS
jgi:hypothetical protein